MLTTDAPIASKETILTLGVIADPKALDLPPFLKNYTIRREANGALYAACQVDGCDVYVVPKAWREKAMKTADSSLNYGVSMPQLQSEMQGTLSTNDPAFGAATMATGTKVPANCDPTPPDASASVREHAVPIALLIVAAVVVFLGRRYRRVP